MKPGADSGKSAPRKLPKKVHLPSGRVARLDEGLARDAAAASSAAPLARALAVLSADGVLRDEAGAAVRPDQLALRDAHVLRAFLGWARVVVEPEIETLCDNCGGPLRIRPSEELEIGPYVDGELGDEELDAPFAFDEAHPCLPIFTSRGAQSSVRLAPRTLADVEMLFSREPGSRWRVTRALVSAMGVVAIGSERKASGIARALEKTDDAAWEEICALYDEAHYPARLFGTARCACGAAVRVPAPATHELFGTPTRSGTRQASRDRPQLDRERFRSLVDSAARRVLEKRRVRGLAICVDEGVPLCDDGGEPLLGCYTPAHTDPDTGVDSPPEVRIFYRTFANELAEIPGFDLEAEIDETVDHEVQHHLYALGGDDPMDEEERAEIAHFEERVVGGRALVRRDVGRGLSDIGRFVKVGWPLIAIAFVAALIKYFSD